MHIAYENPHVPLFVSNDYSENHDESPRGLYGDAVSEMDAMIGEIVENLKKTDQYDNTLIIFLSDNGGEASAANLGSQVSLLICRFVLHSVGQSFKWPRRR